MQPNIFDTKTMLKLENNSWKSDLGATNFGALIIIFCNHNTYVEMNRIRKIKPRPASMTSMSFRMTQPNENQKFFAEKLHFWSFKTKFSIDFDDFGNKF